MASYTARKDKAGNIISYQIKVSRGRDKLTGKQLTPFTMTYPVPEGWSRKAIERELNRVAGEFEAACKRGEVFTKDQQKEQEQERRERVTFAGYVELFIASKSVTLSLGTMESYEPVLNKAVTAFGDTALEDITALQVKGYITALQADGKNETTGKPLAHGSILKHYRVLHSLFASAVDDEVIPYSPMQSMKAPKARKGETAKPAKVYTPEQARYILKCLENEPLMWKAWVTFAADSGCRRGEITGLKWESINFKTGAVTISRNAQWSKTKGAYITSTKGNRNRTIYLANRTLAVMKEWKHQQALMHLGQGIPHSGFCFTGEDGKMMYPSAPTGYLSRFGKKYNLPGIHPHALRHTMATLSIAGGADVVSVSQQLGHSTPSITLDVYAHATEEAQQRAKRVLASALYEDEKQA